MTNHNTYSRITEFQSLSQDGDLLTEGRLSYSLSDGWTGYEPKAPYDAIHVGAAASNLPEDLIKQLKVTEKYP
jgi:protein-L-isoaspartate(D-aspartate) O-methyltransferase